MGRDGVYARRASRAVVADCGGLLAPQYRELCKCWRLVSGLKGRAVEAQGEALGTQADNSHLAL